MSHFFMYYAITQFTCTWNHQLHNPISFVQCFDNFDKKKEKLLFFSTAFSRAKRIIYLKNYLYVCISCAGLKRKLFKNCIHSEMCCQDFLNIRSVFIINTRILKKLLQSTSDKYGIADCHFRDVRIDVYSIGSYTEMPILK